MTREELRTKVIAGIDRILGHPRLISAEEKRILTASKKFWTNDDGTQVDKLLTMLPSQRSKR